MDCNGDLDYHGSGGMVAKLSAATKRALTARSVARAAEVDLDSNNRECDSTEHDAGMGGRPDELRRRQEGP